MTGRAHGTRTKFVHDKCRCLPCRASNAAYANELNRRHLYGRDVLVDPGPARAHLEQLAAAGIGTRRVAALAGISRSVVQAIVRGSRPDRPADRIRPEIAAAILATRPVLANGVPVDGTGTRRRLRALVALGWPQSRLAPEIGWTSSNFTKLITDDTCAVQPRTAAAVRGLYERLWNQQPATDTPQQLAGVNRAKRRAVAAGWVLPAAWDDDEIDDPAAAPHLDETASAPRRGADPEEVDFLLSQGRSVHEIAAHYGVKDETIHRARARAVA